MSGEKARVESGSRGLLFFIISLDILCTCTLENEAELETKGRKWEKFVGHEDLAYKEVYT